MSATLLTRASNLVKADADRIMTIAQTTDPLVKKAIYTLAARVRALGTAEDAIHLQWDDGHILCGVTQPKRFWVRWTLNALNWTDIVCQSCVHVWTHPSNGKER